LILEKVGIVALFLNEQTYAQEFARADLHIAFGHSETDGTPGSQVANERTCMQCVVHISHSQWHMSAMI
jgi:hypothetical protein